MPMTKSLTRKKLFLTAMLCIGLGFVQPFYLPAQQPRIMNSAELQIALKKLLSLGSVLYIAPHPDDENTAALAYLANEKLLRTGYLSLTRGGGGQNLIGSEKGELLSVIRTHELLEARKIDGAEQFFTRAVDFGYSKTSDESIAIWGRENILEDTVFIIRSFQPDILLTRFPPGNDRSGHGHHTASAVLAVEAFLAAGDPLRFPEQLKYVSTWKPRRIFWNSWRPYFRDVKPEEIEKLLTIDVGTYNRLLGKSYYEIAALSRSMHKSQGFGSVPRRGERLDYFELLAGEPAKKDLFEGIDTTWKRVAGSEKVRELLETANRLFQPRQPHKILPQLIKALAELQALPETPWTIHKAEALRAVIRSSAGLWIEAAAESDQVTPGQQLKVTATVINRSGYPLTLNSIIVPGEERQIELNQLLRENSPYTHEFSMKITETEYTHPFWLRQKPRQGLYNAVNHLYKGMALAPYPFNMGVILEAEGSRILLKTPVLYRWRDPVEGERFRRLAVTPPVTANFTGKVFYFSSREPKKIGIILGSGAAAISATLRLNLPPAWKAEPETISVNIDEPQAEKKILFTVTPPAQDSSCEVTADIVVGDKTYRSGQVVIDYPHLPRLTLHPQALARLIRVEVKRRGHRIGYIMGSGDEIPLYLSQLGYTVDLLGNESLPNRDLSIYDAIVTGVRAYNTRDILRHVQKRLLDYVSKGGRLVSQYNVNRGLENQHTGPYPFRLSRGRVCQEDAPVTLLVPEHPLFREPNKIVAADFDNWVQERGLYFADQWDPGYTPLLACHDTGEESQEGGLLFSRFGKGTFIYTGYSFFRQLPAGVPGALKLFVNLISPEAGEEN